jgi:hypothetical protein
MLQSGSGAWGVYAPRPRQRLVGKNNTFRSFREACVYAESVHLMVNGAYQQANQQMTSYKQFINHRRP